MGIFPVPENEKESKMKTKTLCHEDGKVILQLIAENDQEETLLGVLNSQIKKSENKVSIGLFAGSEEKEKKNLLSIGAEKIK